MCVVRAAVSPWLERLEHIFRTALNPLSQSAHTVCLTGLSRVCNEPYRKPGVYGLSAAARRFSVDAHAGCKCPGDGEHSPIDCRVQTSDWAITFCWGVSFICAERGSNKRSAVLT